MDDARESNLTDQANKKDGGGAYSNEKYKEGVYEAIKDVAKRPINKKVQFEEATLIIPENTKINEKLGACTSKRVGNKNYGLLYNELIPGMEEIAQKIIKANGFTKTCN
ncbi:hypothetical protein EII29_11345 [Leptotrichia sp. OH3620_COT-345]|nr:hypothetical protein EII29_11345 [Leptotrichia sp. OH3620_COT-345]